MSENTFKDRLNYIIEIRGVKPVDVALKLYVSLFYNVKIHFKTPFC